MSNQWIVAALALAGLACGKSAETPGGAPPLPETPFRLEVSPFVSAQSGRYVIVSGVIPARHPSPEKTFAAVLFCGGQWRYLGAEQQDFYKDFRMWVDTSAAEIDRNSLTYRDIRISCEPDSSIRIASSDFDKSLALLTASGAGEEALVRTAADGAHYFEFAGASGEARVSVGEAAVAAAGAPVAVRQGAGAAAPVAAGASHAVGAGQPVTVEIQRPGAALKPSDVLTVNRKAGWFSWKRRMPPPAAAPAP